MNCRISLMGTGSFLYGPWNIFSFLPCIQREREQVNKDKGGAKLAKRKRTGTITNGKYFTWCWE